MLVLKSKHVSKGVKVIFVFHFYYLFITLVFRAIKKIEEKPSDFYTPQKLSGVNKNLETYGFFCHKIFYYIFTVLKDHQIWQKWKSW